MITSTDNILSFFQKIYNPTLISLFLMEAIVYSIVNLFIFIPNLYRVVNRKKDHVHANITSDIPGNPHAFSNIFVSFFRTLPEPNNINLVWTRVPLPEKFRNKEIKDIYIEGYLSHPTRMHSMSIYPEGKKLRTNNIIKVLDNKTNKLVGKNEDEYENYDPNISIPRSIELYPNVNEKTYHFRLRITNQYYPHMVDNACVDYIPYEDLNDNKPTGDFLIYSSSYEYALISFRNYLVSPAVKIITPKIYYYTKNNIKKEIKENVIRKSEVLITGCNQLSLLNTERIFSKLWKLIYYYQYLIYFNFFLIFLFYNTNYPLLIDESVNILKQNTPNSLSYLINLIVILIKNVFIVLFDYYITYFNSNYLFTHYTSILISFFYYFSIYFAFTSFPVILFSLLLSNIINDLVLQLSKKNMLASFEDLLGDKYNKNNFVYPDLQTASKVSQPSKLHKYSVCNYNLTPKYFNDLQENNLLNKNDKFEVKYGNILRISEVINSKMQKYWSLVIYDQYGIPFLQVYDDISEKVWIDKENYRVTIELTNLPSNNKENKNYLQEEDGEDILYTEDIVPKEGVNHLDVSNLPNGYIIFRYVHPHQNHPLPTPNTECYTIISKKDYQEMGKNSIKKNI